MRGIDNRPAIELSRKCRPGLQDFARLGGFGHANRRGILDRLFEVTGIAAVQIKQHHFVTQLRVPRDRASAPILGVARMPAGDNYLDFARRRLRRSDSGGE